MTVGVAVFHAIGQSVGVGVGGEGIGFVGRGFSIAIGVFDIIGNAVRIEVFRVAARLAQPVEEGTQGGGAFGGRLFKQGGRVEQGHAPEPEGLSTPPVGRA